MEVDIKIKIKNQGDLSGTAGWLAQNAATIDIGKTKNDNRGAWLLDETIINKAVELMDEAWENGEQPSFKLEDKSG